MISRRSLLFAAPALLCAPAIVRAASLMAVNVQRDQWWVSFTNELIERTEKILSDGNYGWVHIEGQMTGACSRLVVRLCPPNPKTS